MPVIYLRFNTARSQSSFRHVDLTCVAKNRSKKESKRDERNAELLRKPGKRIIFLSWSRPATFPPRKFHAI
jgi:hypothetical protein